jgi:Tfp pilus assembly protein PilF
VLAGLAVLARPTSIIPVGLLLAWAAPRSGRRSAALGCLLILGMITAVSVRNRVAGGEWVPISYNGGINFFIGNARDHDALQDIRPGLQWERLVRTPRALESTGVFHVDPWRHGARQWDQRYVRAAWDDMVGNVPAALGRFVEKGLQFWSIHEIDRNLSPELFFPAGSRWRYLTLPFWLIGPLGLGGLVLLLVDRHRLGVPLALWVFGVMLASVIFFATSRYRAPAYPALAIAAVYLVTRLAAPRRRPPIALLAGAAAVMVADLGSARDIARARPEFLQAVTLERAGRVDEALEWYERALERYPLDPDVLHQPAAAYLARGEAGRARDLAAAASAAIPDHPAPRFNWGLAAMALGRLEEAVEVFELLVAIDPSDARYPYQLGEARFAAGDLEGAVAALRRSAGLAPGVSLPWAALARTYERMGRGGDAADARAEAARRGGGAGQTPGSNANR